MNIWELQQAPGGVVSTHPVDKLIIMLFSVNPVSNFVCTFHRMKIYLNDYLFVTTIDFK